ncbi:6,7-dimethyl-8-ribityllumazine synthase [Candidatus Peregrinibacteria bacterium]|nr:6,7-dimethyl-8-ribityllumazine synthase [Candidatus Peregrinibacteria bacterium]
MEINKFNKVKLKESGLKIAIVLPHFNSKLGNKLLKNAKKELISNNIDKNNIQIFFIAGALELPYACKKIIQRHKPDAIIALGVVIKGETLHFDLVSKYSHYGLMKVQLEMDTPISFGIICANTIDQAKKRVSKNGLNKGKEAAIAALMQTKI